MKTGNNYLPYLLLSLIVFNPLTGSAQGLPIDRFCEIYADSAPQRVDKIIRIFKLTQRPAEQLTGTAQCQTGESFVLKTTCIGPNRIAILTLSHPGAESYPSGATRLFHLTSEKQGEKVLTPCQPVEEN